MNFPEELQYTADHEWVRISGDEAVVGITDFAQRELGDIVYVDINTVGKKVNAGDIFGTVEAVKTVSDLFMPVTGTVTEVNKALDTQPELVNSDCYDSGWMIKVKLDGAAGSDKLISAEEYRKIIGS